MAKKTRSELADMIEDMVDKDQADTTFDTFVQTMLDLTELEIESHVPHARWLLDEATVASVASQQYAVIPTDMDIDALVSARVEGDNRVVHRISPAEADLIDPGRDLTGNEVLYWTQRVGTEDRLYFLYQPDSVDSIVFIFGNKSEYPWSASSNFPLPAKYDWVLIQGALDKVWGRLDPNHDTSRHMIAFEKGINRIVLDANRNPGAIESLATHRPRYGGTGTDGAVFPANFDITP